ncbi:MAG: aspartyl protease family protein [Myxococcaceae bacterium]|nr:aspartyl protease family protein [Myxococcaceae bacterium]
MSVTKQVCLWGLCALLGCRALPRTPAGVLARLEAQPAGHLTGTLAALGPPMVLNREDFVWDARPSPDGTRVALSRLGMRAFHLTVFSLAAPAKPLVDVAVNPVEFNVEALDWSPDGAVIATASRDRSVRLFDAAQGAMRSQWLTDEALTTVAFHPRGELLAVGSAKGLVTVLRWPELAFVAEVRAHRDEVSGLAWAASGELFSSSWDRTVAVWRVEDGEAPVRGSRAAFERKAGLQLFRAVLDGRASASFVVDARVPVVVVRGALAQAAGLDVTSLTETVTIATAAGPQLVPLARARTVTLKGLTLTGLDLAVCDACVPQDAQAVLGQAALERLEVATDAVAGEYVFTPRAGAPGLVASSARQVVRRRVLSFEGSVNDVTVDAAGATLGLALSEAKAERTKAVYDREKRREVEPERPWDCAARVDAGTGQVLERFGGHRGVVSTAAVSPDGRALVSGGWDKKVLLHRGAEAQVESPFGWALRRVRFSRDGRRVVVAAWTPQNPLNDHQSDPAAVVYEARYLDDASVAP